MAILKRSRIRALALWTLSCLVLGSCVPARKYNDCVISIEKCKSENLAYKTEQERLSDQLQQCEDQLQMKAKEVDNLSKDTARLLNTLSLEIMKNNQLNQTYELLLQKNKELLAENRYQTEKISTELSFAQEQLIRKEDALKKLEADLILMQQELKANEAKLNLKEQSLNNLGNDLEKSREQLEKSRSDLDNSQQALEEAQQGLAEKQKKLIELQRILAQKDSMVRVLKNTVSEALLGFSDKGLKVEERNGKVYVSMENKLLFASGSTAVGVDGKKALAEIARVLEANPDINVMVEGHTDDVPLKGSGQMKDNWDLSVLRATEIVRILLDNGKIDPVRLTAAGRSQYLPVDPASTPEARSKNRRTEIILTPKLDELFRVIEPN